MEKDRKYKFEFLLISDNTPKLMDQNVISFQFINKGTQAVLINNQLLLRGAQIATNTFDYFFENLGAGEKTAQSYSIIFADVPNATKVLQVIMKIEVV